MNPRVADLLIKLAEDSAALDSFQAAPERMLDESGVSTRERAAILSNDDAQIFALCEPDRSDALVIAKNWTAADEMPAEAPAVAKIWTGVEGEVPAVAKIWTGVEDETPAVAKIWTGVEDETPAVAKIWTGVEDETPAVAKIWTGVEDDGEPARKRA